MSYKLSDKAKEYMSRSIGIPYEKLQEMDDEELTKYIEEKIGKKLIWPKEAKADGLPIRIMEDVDKKAEKLFGLKPKKDEDELER